MPSRSNPARAPSPWLPIVSAIVFSLAASPALAAPRPKLVVVLVVDQMRADYVERFGSAWRGGLHRLFTEGAYFRNAAFPYLQTITCAGHATISTGAYPYRHGMVQNAWYDRRAGKLISCTNDPTQPLLSYGSPVSGGDSPAFLQVPTLADEMRAQLSPAAKVVTTSLKARSAIMLAGRAAAATTWADAGAFVTSRSYTDAPVPAVANFLGKNPIAWDRLPVWNLLLPPRRYWFADDAPGEAAPHGWTRGFPHALVGANALDSLTNWVRSPFADAYLADLALALVKDLQLGRGPAADYLGISFSVLDLVGHAYGPRSFEVQDVLLRLDQTLGKFLTTLDRLVGKNEYVVALTSDHGVAAIPEQLEALGVPAGRIPVDRLKAGLEAALDRELGAGSHLAAVVYTDIYFAAGVYEKLLAKPGALARVRAAVLGVPGVSEAFFGAELADVAPYEPAARRAAALSYFPGRSGDMVLVPAPNHITVAHGTTHGSNNDYDQRVPLVFAGAGVARGQFSRRVSPADLAPTLGQMVGVTLPRPDGAVLPEVVPAR